MPEDWEALKNMTLEVWEHGFMGVDVGSILVAVLIFGGFLIIRGLFSKVVLYK